MRCPTGCHSTISLRIKIIPVSVNFLFSCYFFACIASVIYVKYLFSFFFSIQESIFHAHHGNNNLTIYFLPAILHFSICSIPILMSMMFTPICCHLPIFFWNKIVPIPSIFFFTSTAISIKGIINYPIFLNPTVENSGNTVKNNTLYHQLYSHP